MSDKDLSPEWLGKFQLTDSENFDELMSVYNVGFAMRKMASLAKPVLTITKEDGIYKFESVTTFKTSIVEFKLGEEFKENTADGAEVDTVINMKSENELSQVQKAVGKRPESEITRVLEGGVITMTIKTPTVTCKRVYKKL
ncbi:Fatty acid-binding protein, heart [Cichlidogyrus casuarinus]|uniref:Fatty acid-binding protein, heart n=1 Tax=Cichlidogyrus casuarinus TaxID=1844966 RepID=A0ABD2QET5_9PLAT